MQTSFFTLSTMRKARVAARPPATANELNPPFNGVFQTWRGPESGHFLAIFSEVVPFALGPRY
jgi:hypothetical protein